MSLIVEFTLLQALPKIANYILRTHFLFLQRTLKNIMLSVKYFLVIGILLKISMSKNGAGPLSQMKTSFSLHR